MPLPRQNRPAPRRWLERHGGLVECFSTAGQGTRFLVSLPSSDETPPTAPAAAPLPADHRARAGGGRTVLFADDERSLRLLAKVVLEGHGYEVLLAEDGRQAVELFRQTNYQGFAHYFGGFGFAEAFRLPGDAEKYPPPAMLPPAEWTVDRFRKAKYALAGTVDQVKAEIESLKRIGGEGELEWFGWFFDQGFMSWDEEMRQIELFVEHIIPALR